MPDRVTNFLLVEDDDIDVESMRRAFARAKVDDPLWIARDGEEALRMLQGDEYPRHRRVVLLDLNLPRMSGIGLLCEMRSDAALQDVPVVVLSTSRDERDRAAAHALKIAGYLVKPAAFPHFVDVVKVIHEYWKLVELP